MANHWRTAKTLHLQQTHDIQQKHRDDTDRYAIYRDMEDKLNEDEKEMLTTALTADFVEGLIAFDNGDIEEPPLPTFWEILEQTPFFHYMSDLIRRLETIEEAA